MDFVLKGLLNHIEADGAEQDERDPVIIGIDHVGEKAAQTIADSGHQSLEAAKPQAGQDHVAPVDFSQRQAFTDGNGKGIHG